MNINKLIKRLKDEHGLSRFLKLSYTDKDIYDIIVNHSLEEWSHYFKQEITFNNVPIGEQNKIGEDLYVIPKYITDIVKKSGLVIEDIKDYRFAGEESLPTVGGFVGNYYEELPLSVAYAGFNTFYNRGGSEVITNLTHACFFSKPNHLKFVFNRQVNFFRLKASMTFYVSQSPNLYAISETREHDFYDLCKYNLQIVLYNNEGKHIENISSGTGNINLKIDEWASAGERKEELLKRLLTYSTISHPAHLPTN